MKISRLVMGVSILMALSSLAATADDTPQPQSPLQAFSCPPVFENPGTVCYVGSGYGQTLSDRPIIANMSAEMIVGSENSSDGETNMIARLSITKIADPTDFYDAYGSLDITASARICSYLRDCYWRQVDTRTSMNRTYGQRYFENGASFDVQISGNSGAEQEEYITEMDLWLPNQQYPIVVKF